MTTSDGHATSQRPRWLPDEELLALVVFVALAGVGSWLHATPLSLFGALGALTVAVLYLWQRWCLVGLGYRRELPVLRAQYGEQVDIEIALVNDKMLPLPWVRVEDEVPPGLAIEGAAPRPIDPLDPTAVVDMSFFVINQSFAMFPFQRTQRRIPVNCDQRGRHHFGISTVSSGDPLGFRQKTVVVEDRVDLIVYPKMFELAPTTFGSRVPIGDNRAAWRLIGDPTRVVGMRSYRVGDPLRHVDWRATARRGELLVRDFEATTMLRVAIFVDLANDPADFISRSAMELRISVAATVLANLSERGLPVGIFAPGTADGEPIAHDPSSAPGRLHTMLELLALCEPDPTNSLGAVLARESLRISRGSIAVVIASEFPESALLAMTECRRRAPITTIFVDTGIGVSPDSAMSDRRFNVEYRDDWRNQDSLQLTT